MIYKSLAKPWLFKKDAEKAHKLAIALASRTNSSPFLQNLAREIYGTNENSLEQEFWGLKFPNPVGLAAGFDKNGVTPKAMQSIGFGFVEVGSITAKASKGNPTPRAFRLPEDRSLINRMGLNNKGADHITERLSKNKPEIPLGINIAKTNDPSIRGDDAIRDYVYSYKKALPVADYVTVNISCPNTGEGKTFEDPVALSELLAGLNVGETEMPTLVKFSADTSRRQLEKQVLICEDHLVNGYVATNTSSQRKGLQTDPLTLTQIGNGGLSGRAIFEQSTKMVRWLSEMLESSKPIIGVGGIDSPEKAVQKLEAGASLIQVYTGLIYEGPGLIKKIKQALIGNKTNSIGV